MSFRRSSRNQNFTVIYNEVAQHVTMTMEARGLLLFMLSLPEDWEYHKGWLKDQCPGWGRDKITKFIKELEKNGFLHRTAKRSEDGKRLAGWVWEVFAESQNPDLRIFSQSENQSVGNTTTTKETSLINKKTTTTDATENFSDSKDSDLHQTRQPEEPPCTKKRHTVESENTKPTFSGSETDLRISRQSVKPPFSEFSETVTGLIDDMVYQEQALPENVQEPSPTYIKTKVMKFWNKYTAPCSADCAVFIIEDWRKIQQREMA